MLALPAPGDDYKTIQQQNAQLQMDKDRSYNELMDIYSLHEFIIRKGKVLD